MSTSFMATSLASSTVPPGDAYTVVVKVDFPMRQYETRRVTDQLDVWLTGSDAPEVGNRLLCTESGGEAVQTSDGTNWQNVGEPSERWSVSLLLTARSPGTAHCEIQAQTSDGHGNAYQMNVAPYASWGALTPHGTWIMISNSDEAGAQEWVYDQIYGPCDPRDTMKLCCDLGDIPGNPDSQDLFRN